MELKIGNKADEATSTKSVSAQRSPRLFLPTRLLICLTIVAIVGISTTDSTVIRNRSTGHFIRQLTRRTRDNEDHQVRHVGKRAASHRATPRTYILKKYLTNISMELIRNARDVTSLSRNQDTHDTTVPCGHCVLRPLRKTLRKEGCHSKSIITASCRGMCETWEIPVHSSSSVIGYNGNRKQHNVCQPQSLTPIRLKLRCRSDHPDPYYLLAVPGNCACAPCVSSRRRSCQPLH